MATDKTGETLSGVLYDTRTNVQMPFTETVHNHAQGGIATPVAGLQAATEGIPMDANATKVKVFDVDAFVAANKDEYSVYPTKIRLSSEDLPLVLASVTVTWNVINTSSVATHPSATISDFIGNGSLSLSPRSTTQATAGVMPVISPVFVETPGGNVDADVYLFYVGTRQLMKNLRARIARFVTRTGVTTTVNTTTNVFTATGAGIADTNEISFTTDGVMYGNMLEDTLYYARDISGSTFKIAATSGGTAIDVLAGGTGTLTVRFAVKAWPNFKPSRCRYALMGQQVSAQAGADINVALSASGPADARISISESSEAGSSNGFDSSLTTRTEDYPTCIHAAITLVTSLGSVASNILTYKQTATATATAHTPAITLDSDPTRIPAVTNTPAAVTLDATGTVFPDVLAATSGVTAIPTSGYYLKDVNLSSTELGQNYLSVTIVDFTQFA